MFPSRQGWSIGYKLFLSVVNLTLEQYQININYNKKVLLRERKRHTARRVVSTPSVVLPGPPPGGYPVRYPPGGWGTRTPPGGYPDPPGGTQSGTPPAAPWHSGKCCKALWDMGTPPPVDRQMDGWKDRRLSKHYLPSYSVRGR